MSGKISPRYHQIIATLVSLTFIVGWMLIAPAGVTAGDGQGMPTAQTAPFSVDDSQVVYSFAQQATFTLQLTSQVEIPRIYLHFQTNDDERSVSEIATVEQTGESVTATYMHDLRLAPISPFATVTFWWRVEDPAGETWPTDQQQFEYTDNRFQWRELADADSHLLVHWIKDQGDIPFGQAALDIARRGIADINAELRAPLPETIDIYIYDSQPNLKAAMILTGRKWIGGQAHPELGVVAIAVANEAGYESRMRRYIPHELTHLLLYQIVGAEGYRYVPEWLDEGLATANEQLPTPELTLTLEQAQGQEQLIPLQELCVPFSPDTETAYLSYAQSHSLVTYIRHQYGAQGIRDLLQAYANGASCASGVREALGIELDELEAAWRNSLEPVAPQETPAPTEAWAKNTTIWLGLWLVSLLAALPMVGKLRRG